VPKISINNLSQFYTFEKATVSKHWTMTGIHQTHRHETQKWQRMRFMHLSE